MQGFDSSQLCRSDMRLQDGWSAVFRRPDEQTLAIFLGAGQRGCREGTPTELNDSNRWRNSLGGMIVKAANLARVPDRPPALDYLLPSDFDQILGERAWCSLKKLSRPAATMVKSPRTLMRRRRQRFWAPSELERGQSHAKLVFGPTAKCRCKSRAHSAGKHE
jgi:hypothetical protein